mmetsp:Transcript_648/g.365  ORF Transcript_648/g.365 Transcript_648/m.365 type:complete len:107 (-) Transcript_648:224-544(-)|eukprot:CAMPEP_0202979390 /NCGR_PEP_ID=MMETSP1396-20130829/85555_1 /ASSEMBLY_ACC=CAM_ASM_000872 /TAXON_ID= /ORGANISM="Pseudokeronopsis sp., Strain Brazil" /LENGTH=106 /DNA_ID=CAMNT_0049718793 /DNA_START=505 /DNA_END=825 /DNA_ORIENTATION=-
MSFGKVNAKKSSITTTPAMINYGLNNPRNTNPLDREIDDEKYKDDSLMILIQNMTGKKAIDLGPAKNMYNAQDSQSPYFNKKIPYIDGIQRSDLNPQKDSLNTQEP